MTIHRFNRVCSNEESSRSDGNWVQEALQNPDWSGDTRMQMSSRKEASVARVDQVGGSRGETVNKDRFSYEGHWFNGAHIHAGAFALPKAVSLSSNAAKNRFLLWAHRPGPFLLPFSPPRSTADPLALSTTGFKATAVREDSPLRFEARESLCGYMGHSWLIGLIGSRRLKRLWRTSDVESLWSDRWIVSSLFFQFDKNVWKKVWFARFVVNHPLVRRAFYFPNGFDKNFFVRFDSKSANSLSI